MTNENMQLDIGRMVTMLKTRKQIDQHTVLVLGSRASNLFHSNELYETMKLFVGEPSFTHLSNLERFAECYRLLIKATSGFSKDDIGAILSQSLKHMDFTDADVCLAELVKSGVFDIILTCTMDNTLEQALEYVGLRELHDFEVFSLHSGITKEELRFGNKVSCHIIKIFGELTSRDYRMQRAGYLIQNQDIRQHLESFSARDLMIIGLDPVWDAEIYTIFPPKGGSLWFVNEEQLKEGSNLFHAGEDRNPIRLWGDTCEYRRFMSNLHERYFGIETDEFSTSDQARSNSVFRVLRRLSKDIRKLQEEVHYCHDLLLSISNQKQG